MVRNRLVSFSIFALIFMLSGCDPAREPQTSNSVTVMQQSQSPEIPYATVSPNYQLSFPRDHYSHPKFRTEWWYLTANLSTPDNRRFGVQWTLFRLASGVHEGEGWKTPQVYMAHSVVTSEDGIWHAERFARGGVGLAGVEPKPFSAWLDNWLWQADNETPFPAKLTFSDGGMQAELQIENSGELILQGDKGYSRKHPTEAIASHYYSAPFLKISGTLTLDGKESKVAGEGWFDREWSSEGLASDQQGWDWFSLHLDDGSALMVYQVRSNKKHYAFASRGYADGTVTTFDPEQVILEPDGETTLDSGVTLPLEWRVSIPSQDINIEVSPLREEQWLPFMFPYWEGPIEFSGSHQGNGFMELTGY